MSRSRSSFDLSGAIATATSLSVTTPEEEPAAIYRGVPLVSFGPTAAGLPTVLPPVSDADSRVSPAPLVSRAEALTPEAARRGGPRAPANEGTEPALPDSGRDPVIDPPQPASAVEDSTTDGARKPPKLPDLSGTRDPLLRCARILEWIVEAVGVANVFIADAAGLPVAGDTSDGEGRLAATGVVTAAVAHLAASIPGNTSALFEMHVGEGPFFQVIGFEAAGAPYVVGFQRATPLAFRQAHAVRLACRHALEMGNPGHSMGNAERAHGSSLESTSTAASRAAGDV